VNIAIPINIIIKVVDKLKRIEIFWGKGAFKRECWNSWIMAVRGLSDQINWYL